MKELDKSAHNIIGLEGFIVPRKEFLACSLGPLNFNFKLRVKWV